MPLSFKQRIEACQSVGMESWGYRKEEDYYSLRYLTSSIAKYRARDANYLLNAGPDADGVIPEKPAGILRQIGTWYKPVRESFDGAAPVSAITANRNVLHHAQGKQPVRALVFSHPTAKKCACVRWQLLLSARCCSTTAVQSNGGSISRRWSGPITSRTCDCTGCR